MDKLDVNFPPLLKTIQEATIAMGFTMGSDELTGSLLKTLTAAKPAGMFLELGTGTGLATTWLLDGMDTRSQLMTVDSDEKVAAVARRYLGQDSRVTFYTMNGATFIQSMQRQEPTFDLIFADTWPGKYHLLDETLRLLKIGGLYVIDDMLPQASWPADHAPKVLKLIAQLERRKDLYLTKLNWSTGLIIAAKINPAKEGIRYD